MLVLLLATHAPADARDEWVCLGPCDLLGMGKIIFVGTAIEKVPDIGDTRFLVTEAFKGTKRGKYVIADLDFQSGGFRFELGKSYIVFLEDFLGDGSYLIPARCLTRQLDSAQAILQQLRAQKRGESVAAAYGMLSLSLDDSPGHDRPVPNVVVRFQSAKKSFKTRTNEFGVYAFDRLPAGQYRVTADLPPDLTLDVPPLGDVDAALRNLKPPAPIFELPPHSCYSFDLYAEPTGRKR